MTSQKSVNILVSGQASTSHAPELANVHLTVSCQGKPDAREATTERVRVTQSGLSSLLNSLKQSSTSQELRKEGGVVRWNTGALSSSNVSEWDNEARKSRVVGFRVSIRLEARFAKSTSSNGDSSDARDGSKEEKGWSKLAEFVKTLATTPDVELNDISWVLTDSSALRLAREVQVQAVIDAKQKAANYASALGLQTVTATEIVDGEYQGNGSSGAGAMNASMPRAMLRSAAPGGSGEESLFAFEPKDIEVSANVNARFAAT